MDLPVGHKECDLQARSYERITSFLDFLQKKNPCTEVVSGRAKGVDRLGEEWAWYHNLKVQPFPADWKRMGQRAGPLRNIEMGAYADDAVVFIRNYSRGSLHMVSVMKDLGKPVLILHFRDCLFDRGERINNFSTPHFCS